MSEYRSFRLFKETYTPPERTSADYSESEKQMFQNEFKPIGHRYRFCSKVFIVVVIALFIPMFFGWMNGTQLGKWFAFFFFGIIASGIIISLFLQPVCPACKRKPEDGIRKFCPECGSCDLTPRSFLLWAKCHSCGKELRQRKGRSYKIRFCTHCGVFLDGKGI